MSVEDVVRKLVADTIAEERQANYFATLDGVEREDPEDPTSRFVDDDGNTVRWDANGTAYSVDKDGEVIEEEDEEEVDFASLNQADAISEVQECSDFETLKEFRTIEEEGKDRVKVLNAIDEREEELRDQ